MERLFKLKHFLTTEVYKTIFDIDYEKLYQEKIRLIIFDLDNTLIPYHTAKLTKEVKTKLKSLMDRGFECVIISNNFKKRVLKAVDEFNIKFISLSFKPLIFKIKRTIKKLNFSTQEAVLIGDQLMTDVLASNRLKIRPILVNPIDTTTEKHSTIKNRKREKRILKRIQKKYPEVYCIYEKRKYL